MALPQVGEVHDGYRYNGGDPNSKTAWSWAGEGASAPSPKLSPQDASYIDALRTEAAKSLNNATQGERFLAINKKTPTGGPAGAPFGIGAVTRDIRSSRDPNWATMEGITSAVAPSMRPPGSGSSSDKDAEMYTRGFLNTRVPYEANKQSYDRIHQQSDHDAAHAAFIDTWYQHKGSLLGGEEAFAKYWAQKSGNQPAGAGPAAGGAKRLRWNPKTGDFDQ